MATFGLLALGRVVAADAEASFRSHLGLQLYSLREEFKVDVAGALDRAKGWGFTEVETAGTAGLPVAKFLALLRARGLTPVSAHIGYELLDRDLVGAVEEARALGVQYAICPSIPHQDRLGAEEARAAAAKFNRWGSAFREAGIQFGYHTHGYEFFAAAPGSEDTVFDVLVRATDPHLVCLEMDVLWVYRAGMDPVALLRKYSGRWVMLHVKDLRRGAARGPEIGWSAPATDKIAVGTGQIDWPAVLRAAEAVGVQYYFIEDETPDPVECIPESLRWLRAQKG